MIKAEVIDALIAAGATAEMLAEAFKADQARASGARRQAAYRARKASLVTLRDVTERNVTSPPPPPKEIPPIPPKEITPTPDTDSLQRAREAFVEFRKIYPKRAGSQPWTPAEKKFLAICGGGVLPDEILAGATAYSKSEAADDPQFVAQAITWLNQNRWTDDYPPRMARTASNGHGRSNGTTAFVQSVLQDIENDKRRREEGDSKIIPMLQRNGG